MSEIVSFYPLLDLDIIEKVNPKISYSFSYNGKKGIHSLDVKNDHNILNVDFETSYWNPDDYDLIVNVQLLLNNPKVLFGKYGVAPTNSKIGVCFECFSSQSKIRFVINANEYISYDRDEQEFNFECNLPKNRLFGALTFNIILYLLKEDMNVSSEEKFLNNKPGIILGVLDKKVFQLDGSGSLFPITISNLPNEKRLWTVDVNYNEPYSSILSESLTLTFNSAHKDYCLVDPENAHYCERLVEEIVCNAIAYLLFKLKSDGYLDNLDENIANENEVGTVAQYAIYCKNNMNINFENHYTIMESLRNFSEENK